jgi:hypothetical protein
MSHIVIGKSGEKNVSIDLETLLSTRLLIQANSGGGKSWLLRRLAEQLFGKIPVIIIDPEGEFATLREKLDFFLVGEGGDIPADVRSAGLLAETLLKLKASAVIDLFEGYRKNPIGRHLWVKAFLEGMLDAPKSLRHPTILIVDEAHMFCPEQGESPAEGVMVGIAGAGRKRGIAAIWATQRLALLDKNASSQLQNRMVGLTFEDVDVDRAVALLSVPPELKHEFKAQVKVLEPGQFFAFGRAISKERILVNVGPVETSHPKVGTANYSAAPPPAPAKIRELLPKLADLPQAAEEKAKTEKELRLEIRNLKAQIRSSPKETVTTKVDTRAIERAVRPLRELLRDAMKIIVKVEALGDFAGLKEEETAALLDAVKREVRKLANEKLAARDTKLQALRREANRLSARIKQLLDDSSDKIQIDVTAAPASKVSGEASSHAAISAREIHKGEPSHSQSVSRGATTATQDHPRPNDLNGDLNPPRKAILRAIAEFEAIGREQISKSWIAARSGASYTSSAYGNNLGYLRSNGYIEYPGPDKAALTDKGRNAAGPIEPPETSEEVLQSCMKLLSGSQQSILKALHEKYPEPVDKTELADLAGASATSSAYGNNLGALRSAGMIEYPAPGKAKCADWLFLE